MYVPEWIGWLAYHNPNSWLRKHSGEMEWGKLLKDLEGDRCYTETLAEKQAKQDGERYPHARIVAPVYACNDTYIDLRCGVLENQRGYITLVVLVLLFLGGYLYTGFGIRVAFDTYKIYISPDKALDFMDFALFFLFTATPIAFWFIFFKWLLPFSRLEMLTSRHLVARFNRVTKQVYLHRPKNCGGIAVMAWREAERQYAAPYPLVLMWTPYFRDFPPTFIAVGKNAMPQEQEELWEFLRRYMDEDGLARVEPPKIWTVLPSPYAAWVAYFENFNPFAEDNHPLMKIGGALLSPFFVLMVVAHFVSLCLCWTPRFPKIIREAGQPGKPVPKLTTIDDYPPKIRAALAEKMAWFKPIEGKAPVTSEKAVDSGQNEE